MTASFFSGFFCMETYEPNVSSVSSKGVSPPASQQIADVQVILPATSEGFLNPPPPARSDVNNIYVYLPKSQYPNVFGDLRKSKERCAFLRENGLRV